MTVATFTCRICRREIPSLEAGCPYCLARARPMTEASPRTLAILAVAMLVLLVLTGYLSHLFHEEEASRGQQHAERAGLLLEAGDYDASIAEYREALTYARDSLDYRLNLAVALVETGRTSEAESHFTDTLAVDSTLALPNLHLARIAANRGDVERAAMHYRRALYGRWPSDPVEHRVQTRFELVALLERAGEQMQGVAELLDLLDEEPDDPDIASRAAWALLSVGAPGRALEVFERIIEEQPRDAVAHSGVAEAEFALNHYLTARTYFRRALNLQPSLTHLETRLALCDEINALDPTLRGLGRISRYDRSVSIVRRALTVVDACLPPPAPSDDAQAPDATPEPGTEPSTTPVMNDVAQARALVEATRRRTVDDDLTEANLVLAERLWRTAADSCPDAAQTDEALGHVLGKLSTS